MKRDDMKLFLYLIVILVIASVAYHISEKFSGFAVMGRVKSGAENQEVKNTERSSITTQSKNQQLSEVNQQLRYVKGSLLVKYKVGYDPSLPIFKEINNRLGLQKIQELFPSHKSEPLISNVYELRISPSVDVEKAASDYMKLEGIEFAQPNFIAYTTQQTTQKPQEVIILPNDPYYRSEWHLPEVSAPSTWGVTKGRSDSVIAVIDTGVNWYHQDLANSMWINTLEDIDGDGKMTSSDFNKVDDDNNGYIDDVLGYDFVEVSIPSICWTGEDCTIEDNDPDDFHGHGTHVSGIISAVTNNKIGVSSVCWFCKIMPIRAGFAINLGGPIPGGGLEYDDTAQALVYAADNGADIISMSFGGIIDPLMQSAISYADNKGMILVAAAGNSNSDGMLYPAAYSNVNAVAATDQTNQKAYFSSYGAWVDVAAPGVNIWSTLPPSKQLGTTCWDQDGDGYDDCSGTSMATPLVSGIVGLILSNDPSLNKAQVETLIHTAVNAPSSSNYYIGTGVINAFKAVSQNPVSIALIDDSLNNAVINNNNVQIIGTATGPNFVKYRLEYGNGIYPSQWNIISDNNVNQVTNGILGTWTIPPGNGGINTIRLAVTDAANNEWEDRAIINVEWLPPNLIIGAPNFGTSSNGKIYVNEVWTAIGNNQDYLGGSVSDVPDLNNDGIGDIITGINKGVSIFSGADGSLLWQKTSSTPYDQFGSRVLGVSDLDGDNLGEVVVSAPAYNTNDGIIYVYSGSAGNLIWSKSAENNDDYFGSSMGKVPDTDGDGIMDIVVSAPFNNQNTGKVYLLSGKTGSTIWTKQGEAAYDQFGNVVSGTPDLNDDGIGDVIVGAPSYGASNYGKIYVYSGKDGKILWSKLGSFGNTYGYEVSGVKDLNGDGLGDVVVGLFIGSNPLGEIEVYSGVDGVLLWSQVGQPDISLYGGGFGSIISDIKDVNNDGFGDIVVGAPSFADIILGPNTGRVYVYSGKDGNIIGFKTGEASGISYGAAVSGFPTF